MADTWVSRLHCSIRLQACTAGSQAVLKDHSSNGTYVNGTRVKAGETVCLQSGDKICLVRSMSPWAELGFTFLEGGLPAIALYTADAGGCAKHCATVSRLRYDLCLPH